MASQINGNLQGLLKGGATASTQGLEKPKTQTANNLNIDKTNEDCKIETAFESIESENISSIMPRTPDKGPFGGVLNGPLGDIILNGPGGPRPTPPTGPNNAPDEMFGKFAEWIKENGIETSPEK